MHLNIGQMKYNRRMPGTFFGASVSCIIFCIIVMLVPGLHAAENAGSFDVCNVSFREEEENIIITYDLLGEEGKTYTVSVAVSYNFGETFSIIPQSMSGDAGKGISPGENKKIVWHVRDDYPDGLRGDGFVFAVHAVESTFHINMPLIMTAAAVTGGVVWLVSELFSRKEQSPYGKLKFEVPADI